MNTGRIEVKNNGVSLNAPKGIAQNSNAYILRTANIQDCDQIRQLYKSVVNLLSLNDFTVQQKNVWSAVSEDRAYWLYILQTQQVVVAEYLEEKDQSNHIIGFGSIKDEGYIEFLYVATDFQNIGVGRRILKALENYASKMQAEEIWADVSTNARSFFSRHNFVAEHTYTREVKECNFKNVLMRKIFRRHVN